MRWSARIPAAAALVAVLCIGCGSDSDRAGASDVDGVVDPNPNAPLAPPFTLETLDGSTIALADFDGDVVLLNFWATWCPPCREEMPLFQDLRSRLASEGFEILAVTIDEDPHEVVPPFVDEFGLDFPILIGTTKLLGDYEFFGLPTTFIISREGRIVEVLDGAQPLDVFEPLVRRHL